jgi:hypothetical protein
MLAAKDFTTQKDRIANLKIPDKYPIALGPDQIGMLKAPDNPTPLQLVEMWLRHSSVQDVTSPRNRFIRATELLSGLMTVHLYSPTKTDPPF